ncbi:hypothetical protein [Arcicella lustrica]|uniref:Uncharacterized protein n=1 Tax=Arcicella lustrica TaxID=2984196 RepID=A0ABU5SJT9_9BACT|nr:hypothetical protein [Arcicella sp. DC25W]MEA5427499.1 hypothetical protein [Arcicella sp. DC25W]
MEELSLEQKIDSVFFILRILYVNNLSVEKEKLWDLVTKNQTDNDINRILFEEIINKLLEDGYIRRVTKSTDSFTIYNVTLKGLTFLGYVHQQKKENEEKR